MGSEKIYEYPHYKHFCIQNYLYIYIYEKKRVFFTPIENFSYYSPGKAAIQAPKGVGEKKGGKCDQIKKKEYF